MAIESIGSQPENTSNEVETLESDDFSINQEKRQGLQAAQETLGYALSHQGQAESPEKAAAAQEYIDKFEFSDEVKKKQEEARNEISLRELDKIAAVSEDIKEFKSPEEIKNEIKRLQEEYQMKKEAYQAFTHISSTDTGLGALGSISAGVESPESLEKKFPGISSALELIKRAEKKNNVGLKFWKTPELGDFELQVIKNYLTTGSMGKFTNPNAEAMAQKALDKFMSDNNDLGANSGNVKKAIWGNNDVNYYEGAIANLNNKLVEPNESK